MQTTRDTVHLSSLGDELEGVLLLPETETLLPAVILCHGAGEFKENYLELGEWLADRGVATLTLDMHGHGRSSGERYHVNMEQWVADVRAAVDFLVAQPRIDGNKIAAFGLSSGGTAVLEAALVEPRLGALVVLDATVRDSLPRPLSWVLKFLILIGKIKHRLTKTDLRLPLAKLGGFEVASDPELNRRLQSDPRATAAFMAFPFPGGAQAFFVDTLRRVPQITAPTLVLWGEDDKLDPPETARLLYRALTCRKQLHIIPGNGHVGHLDRHKEKVFALTADWILQNLAAAPAVKKTGAGRQHGIPNRQCGRSPETRSAGEMGTAFAVS